MLLHGRIRWYVVVVVTFILSAQGSRAAALCQQSLAGGIPVNNVEWAYAGNVSACAAGDSVVGGRPCRLRITVSYSDNNCNPRPGVPPESMGLPGLVWVKERG